jgi:hypothetical protein
MNRFYITPGVDCGEGLLRILQSEHNGRTRAIYEKKMTVKEFRHYERQFRKAADELEALENDS